MPRDVCMVPDQLRLQLSLSTCKTPCIPGAASASCSHPIHVPRNPEGQHHHHLCRCTTTNLRVATMHAGSCILALCHGIPHHIRSMKCTTSGWLAAPAHGGQCSRCMGGASHCNCGLGSRCIGATHMQHCAPCSKRGKEPSGTFCISYCGDCHT